MTSEIFVNVLKQVVRDQSVKNTIATLEDPPGKTPNPEILAISNFYKNLSVQDRQSVHRILELVADDTLFGMLCVLDGVRAIEGPGEKGNLELFFEKDSIRTLLNNPDLEYLHDLI